MSKNKTILKISAKTHKGMVREHNEDDHLFCPDLKSNQWMFYEKTDSYKLGEFGSLIIVADGMGGMNAGEVASRLAKEGIQEYFSANLRKEVLQDESKVKSFMKDAILSANEKIIKYQKKDKKTEGMGTTIILAWIHTNKVYISWSGDSRCYRYNQESGLQLLSKDHSYVQELIDKGKLTEEQAFYHPDGNIVTQSLGDEKHKPNPDFRSYELHEGDKILLCSDGLNAMLQDFQIREIFEKNPEINTCVDTLIEEANKAGGYDNITIVIAEIEKVGRAFVTMKNMVDKLKTYAKYAAIAIFAFLIVFVYLEFFHKKEETEKQNIPTVPSDSSPITKITDNTQNTTSTNNGNASGKTEKSTDNKQLEETNTTETASTDSSNLTLIVRNEESSLTVIPNKELQQLPDILKKIEEALDAAKAQGPNTDNFKNQIQVVESAYENYLIDQSDSNKTAVCTKIDELIKLRENLKIESKNFKDAFGELRTFYSNFCKDYSHGKGGGITEIKKDTDENNKKLETNDEIKYDATKDPDNIGLSPIKQGDKWGYVGKDDKIKIECKYNWAYQFYEGYAFVKFENGWGVIDTTGKIIIPEQSIWRPSIGFSGGKAKVVIDSTGEEICINIKNEFVDCGN